MDANHPSAKKNPLIQLYLHPLDFLNRLRIIGVKLWEFGIQRGSFLQSYVQKCLSLINSCFRNWNQISKSSGSRPFMPHDKASYHSHGVFDDVDCFNRLPKSFFSRWQSSPSLPLYQKHYLLEPQMRPLTSQAVVPYSATPPTARDDTSLSPLASSSATTRAEDEFNRDPPGLSKELSDFQLIGVTSSEFERYERDFISYVLSTDHQ